MEDNPLMETQKRMSKGEAEKLHAQIITGAKTFAHDYGRMLLRMETERGWEALGYHSLKEYMGAIRGEVGESTLYRWKDTAEVNANLTLGMGKVIELPVSSAMLLKDLPPEQQLAVIKEVGSGEVNMKSVSKVVARIAPAARKKKKKAPDEEPPGWTDADLKDDQQLTIALGQIRGLWGAADEKFLRNGTIGYTRKEIIKLSKVPKPKIDHIRDLVMVNRWDVDTCLKFINRMPNEFSTIEDLQNWCLAEKGKFLQVEIQGFIITVKLKNAVKRPT